MSSIDGDLAQWRLCLLFYRRPFNEISMNPLTLLVHGAPNSPVLSEIMPDIDQANVLHYSITQGGPEKSLESSTKCSSCGKKLAKDELRIVAKGISLSVSENPRFKLFSMCTSALCVRRAKENRNAILPTFAWARMRDAMSNTTFNKSISPNHFMLQNSKTDDLLIQEALVSTETPRWLHSDDANAPAIYLRSIGRKVQIKCRKR